MAPQFTLRIEEKTRKQIARIARREGLSASEVIRRSIDAWVQHQEPPVIPFELISDLLGVVHSGNAKRSEQTGRRWTKLLKSRRVSS